MAGRNMQIKGLRHTYPRRNDHDGLRIDELRLGKVSDVETAVKTGLTDTDRSTDVGGRRRRDRNEYHDDEENVFHA